MKFQGQLNNSISKDQLKRPISPFLEAGFEKFLQQSYVEPDMEA